MPDTTKFTHAETDHSKITMAQAGSAEEFKKLITRMELDGGIKVIMTDRRLKEPMEFRLYGFIIVRDAAKIDVLYYKPKPGKGEAVYYLTDHPNAQDVLRMLQNSLPGTAWVNMEDTLREMMEAFIQKQVNNPGIHPDMAYLEGKP